MNKTLICFALKAEAKPFQRRRPPSEALSILVTGMGMASTQKAIEAALALQTPSWVLTCGLAGALNPVLRLNDVIYESDAELAPASLFQDIGAIPARFYCSPMIVAAASAKENLHRQTGADAVDMESQVIRDACKARGIPSATVRVVSDLAQETLPLDFNRFLNRDLSMNYAKIALALAVTPRALPALLHFQKQTAAAADKLGLYLARFCARFPGK